MLQSVVQRLGVDPHEHVANDRFTGHDESLAIDGKTMCNAIDAQGQQTHVMRVVGHTSKICYTESNWILGVQEFSVQV